MDRLLVDTNIVIDLLAKREEFYHEAQELFTLADSGEVKLIVSALTFANTHYLLSKANKLEDARKILARFKSLVEVAALNDKIVGLALASDFKGFEDAIQYHTALENGAIMIITRNQRDFKNSMLPVITAKEYLTK